MPELFVLPEKIPPSRKRITLYRTTELKTLSPRESTVARYFDKRLKKLRESFDLRQEPEDLGDTFAFKEKEFDLEVYKASDSIWMANRELAFQESLPKGAQLPEDGDAAERARAFLEKHDVDLNHARLRSVTHTEVVHDGSRGKEGESLRTAVNVNFSFDVGDIEVVGPGAKTQVSFCDRDVVSHLHHFWREPREADEMDVILPDEALERFMKDPRFIRLDERSASVRLHEVKLNYFALPPFEFQRYLIPVYSVEGTATTEDLPQYHFTSHVVAVKVTPEEVKKAGIVANPNSCQIFD